jgi:hypothetical protein
MDMLLTGRFVGALEAQQIGLVSRVVPLPAHGGDASADASADTSAEAERRAVHASAHDVALCNAQRSGPALAIGKRTFNAPELPLAEAYKAASRAMTGNLATRDAAEGIAGFLAKRSPTWLHKSGELATHDAGGQRGFPRQTLAELANTCITYLPPYIHDIQIIPYLGNRATILQGVGSAKPQGGRPRTGCAPGN